VWANPHVYITIEQTNGVMTKEWDVECFAPVMMSRLGWTKQTLHVGDVLTITGSPGRATNTKGLLAGSIKRADSTLYSFEKLAKAYAPNDNAPKFKAKGLTGIWDTTPDFQLLAQSAAPNAALLTSEGAKIFASFDEKAMSPVSNCIHATAPLTMVMADMKLITAGDGFLTIEAELDGAQRTVYLNKSTHDGAIPSHQGHSIGQWEGKTFVIDTTHFAYHAAGNGLNVPSSTQKHLIEWLTPSADGTSLTYRFEMQDPEILKAPRVGEIKWSYRPDMKFAPEPCNLDSARRFLKN
jgi:hypothetical protein